MAVRWKPRREPSWRKVLVPLPTSRTSQSSFNAASNHLTPNLCRSPDAKWSASRLSSAIFPHRRADSAQSLAKLTHTPCHRPPFPRAQTLAPRFDERSRLSRFGKAASSSVMILLRDPLTGTVFKSVSSHRRRSVETSALPILFPPYSTVTLLARFLGWSTSVPFRTAMW